MTKDTFTEQPLETIWNLYRNGVLVECPRCRLQAQVTPQDLHAATLTCGNCGYAKEYMHRSSWSSSDESMHGREHYSQTQLWLQTRCCGKRLWALNREHVEWLEGYVGADLRTRNIEDGCVNSCLNSRIPKWISSKKNREQVLAGVQKLKDKLGDTRNV